MRFKWLPEKGVAWIKPTPKEAVLLSRLQERLDAREARKGDFIPIQVSLDLQYEKKTFKQLRTAWKLIEVYFESQEGRKPTDEERYDLYLDLLEEYADRIPSRLHPDRTRPIHLSEANTIQAAHFIQALFDWIADMIGLEDTLQADVRDLFWEWERYRGDLEYDPLDYQDAECKVPQTVKLWWERHPVCEATGVAGRLELAHIVTRGASPENIESPFNWLALDASVHHLQHQYGWEWFLNEYPHLRGRVERARKLCGKRDLEGAELPEDAETGMAESHERSVM
jgi:hypothetical protein